ncbi:type II secretion system F family protein [Nocardioides sp. SYSU DS0663]|uniref:type II secretion system F family protein n=1 Tax=Nocardioides sp. SYSU DS0663 TaxID=3416445 RepID=UPI003F4CA68B
MTAATWGGVLGATLAAGLMLVAVRAVAWRRTPLTVRVLPYLRDLPRTSPGVPSAAPGPPTSVVAAVYGPPLRSAAQTVERVLGGTASVKRRLERAGLSGTSVHDFRVQQVLWGLAGFALAAAYGLLEALTDPGGALASAMLCLVAFAAGVLARDNHLTGQVRARERRILAEFPTVAELLALSVAAGESPVAALDRVVRRSGGDLSADLGKVLAAVRTGEPVPSAFDRLASASGLPLVSRFAQGIAVAVERGTPLADVLHAQAADVREAGRRELIEVAARREVLMMVPVVFLVLPVTVLFAFWPGVVGLSLTTP